MGSVPLLLTFLLMLVSGWVRRHELIVIEFLQAAGCRQVAARCRQAGATGFPEVCHLGLLESTAQREGSRVGLAAAMRTSSHPF